MNQDTNVTISNHTPFDPANMQKTTITRAASHNKEGEPVLSKSEPLVYEEQKLDESEPQIKDAEVKKYISSSNHVPTLDPVLKKAGLSLIETESLDPRLRLKLPISDQKIIIGQKKPLSSGWRWFSELLIYYLRKAHIKLKVIHGHVVRVIIH